QFPQAQFAPGQFPQAQFAPGQFPQAQLAPGQFPQAQFAPGQFPQAQLAPGQFPQAQFAPGQFPQAQLAPEQFSPGEAVPNRPTSPPGQFSGSQFSGSRALHASPSQVASRQHSGAHPASSSDRFGYGADRVLPQDRGADHRRGEDSRGSQPPGSARGVRNAPYIANTRLEQLIDKHTFRNFVVGPSNELAYAAASAAAGGGGPRYNPLFICGPTGLGKTHLMHAIALKVLEERPNACVLYVSAERFTNQFIEALQHHNMEAFRQRYRFECDLLLVDDIQFLAGREQTQEEFFHTFNALHDADKPIVVSSDKYPQDLQKMPERLISRFNSGLVADIQTPALETRVAIVRKKAALEGIPLDDEVAVLLAQTFKSNVRELEGSLIRLAAKSSLTGVPINIDFARNEISVVAQRAPEVRSVTDIQSAVCGHFRVTNSELLSKDRHKSVAFARQVAMYLCRQRLKCSFPELGRAFGNRDHTTVMSAVRRVASLRQTDPQVNAHLEAIENRLSAEED
ncbi:MAG: chromosomal replication initiator protein DnaA, partial [Pseudomonadota bacterium]